MWQTVWKAIQGEYGGRLLGVLFGLFCGVLYLFAGFWDMLIFTVIVYIGFTIGRIIDGRRAPFDVRPLWLWLTERWRGFK
jgi:uncharacterized membrane protein